jgi:hypothetical protein
LIPGSSDDSGDSGNPSDNTDNGNAGQNNPTNPANTVNPASVNVTNPKTTGSGAGYLCASLAALAAFSATAVIRFRKKKED